MKMNQNQTKNNEGRMQVWDANGSTATVDKQQVETIIRKAFNIGSSSFWFAMQSGGYPSLNLLIDGGFAYAHFFDCDGSAGYVATSPAIADPKDIVSFRTTPQGEAISVAKQLAIASDAALAIAGFFVEKNAMSSDVKWIKL
jgi:hypothetical protein